MVDPQVRPQVVVDPHPAQEGQHQQQTTQTYAAEPRVIIDKADEAAYRHALLQQQRKPAGPQLWAVVFTLAGLYYIWTRVLGKPLLSRSGLRGGQIGANYSSGAISSSSSSNSNRQAEIAAARERQQRRLELMSKAKEHTNNNGNSNLRERTNNIKSCNSKLSINQKQQLLQQQKEQTQKSQELKQKKKKQRRLYEEEKRRKDKELGPNAHNSMDPNQRAMDVAGLQSASTSVATNSIERVFFNNDVFMSILSFVNVEDMFSFSLTSKVYQSKAKEVAKEWYAYHQQDMRMVKRTCQIYHLRN